MRNIDPVIITNVTATVASRKDLFEKVLWLLCLNDSKFLVSPHKNYRRSQKLVGIFHPEMSIF